MLETIVLHVGSPKCGSTYFQRVLLGNAARLRAAGIAYPHAGGPHPGNAAEIATLTGPGLDALATGAHTLVLSHEDLFSQAPRAEALAALVADRGLRLELLVFLRPFSGFIFGDYSQFLKQHFDRYLADRAPHDGRGFEAFTVDRARVLAVTGWLRAWARKFPGQTLTLANPADIRQVTEPLLGGLELDWEVPRDQANPSLRMEDCDRLVAALKDRSVSRRAARQMLREARLRSGAPDAGRTEERIAWIEAIFAKQNADILESFGFDNRLAAPKSGQGPVSRTL